MTDDMDRARKILTDELANAYRALDRYEALSAEQRAAVLVILASTCMERRRHERAIQAGANWEAQHRKRWKVWIEIRDFPTAAAAQARLSAEASTP